jgi:hypothetical protein
MEREALLYLHHRGARYRFDTVANINNLIRGEREGLTGDEVLVRVREELERELERGGDRREVVVWPESSAQIRDHGARFRIVYLAPDWTEAALPLGQSVLKHGDALRVYRNGLAFARPTPSVFDTARQAARTLLAIERLQSSSRVMLTEEQKDDLRERATEARGELTAAMPTSYDAVLVPREIKDGREVLFDTIELGAILGAGRRLHERIHDALDATVFESITPSRLATIARLDEGPAWCERLADDFWRYVERPKLWGVDAIVTAVAEGVSKGVFGYATGARDEKGRPVVDNPTSLRLGEPLRSEDVDLGPGAVLLSLADAEKLRSRAKTGLDSEEGEQPEPGDGENGITKPPPPKPPERTGAASVSVQLRATQEDLHALQRALSALRDLVRPGEVRIELTASASSPSGPIDRVAFANRVQEALDEGQDVEILSIDWNEAGGEIKPVD